jgi:hypothetical protein
MPKTNAKCMERYTPPFKTLKPSTQVVMIYTNMEFNNKAIFDNLPYHKISDPPLTKKYKNIDKKKLTAPYGSIVSIQSSNNVRGLDMRNKKKKAVPKNPLAKKTHTKKIDYFLNETTIVLFLKNISVNIMIFKGIFKIAGCRYEDDAFESIMLLWDHIKQIKNSYKILPEYEDTYPHPAFLADVAMKNVGFSLGFQIDRYALNILMNKDEYIDTVYLSQYEPTGHPNVNIKMFGATPGDINYDILIIQPGKKEFFENVNENIFRTVKKKEKEKYTTAIAFSSGEIILTGRYKNAMKRAYNFIIKQVFQHRNEIEIKLIQHQKFDRKELIKQLSSSEIICK